MRAAQHEGAPLLARYPLIVSRDADDASARMSRVFSPHRLEVKGSAAALDVRHNQVRLGTVSLNVLSYGTEVLIDPGERGDFYMVQLPLRGAARLSCGGREAHVDRDVLSILPPRARSRMLWSGDCTMILLQVPRDIVERRAAEWGVATEPRFALSRSRSDPEVAAWWQAVSHFTLNVDRFGSHWLSQPTAVAVTEQFLISGFASMLERHPPGARASVADARCVQRAKEYIHAHTDRSLTLDEIARHACVCPRTVERLFKRVGEEPPLAYSRRLRLDAVRRTLTAASRAGEAVGVTEVALDHGFVHMGRFAAQYRRQFGCSPSETVGRGARAT